MRDLTREELDSFVGNHWTREGETCCECLTPWPCTTRRLVSEVQRWRAADQHESDMADWRGTGGF